ncbi:hypothetical protein D3C78_1151060 [compost metagenome]
MRIGIGAIAFGDNVSQLAVTGKFRMLVHRGIEDPHLLPFAGITCRVSLVGMDSPQPPVSIEFIAAPTGRIAALPPFGIGRGLCTTGGQQRA